MHVEERAELGRRVAAPSSRRAGLRARAGPRRSRASKRSISAVDLRGAGSCSARLRASRARRAAPARWRCRPRRRYRGARSSPSRCARATRAVRYDACSPKPVARAAAADRASSPPLRPGRRSRARTVRADAPPPAASRRRCCARSRARRSTTSATLQRKRDARRTICARTRARADPSGLVMSISRVCMTRRSSQLRNEAARLGWAGSLPIEPARHRLVPQFVCTFDVQRQLNRFALAAGRHWPSPKQSPISAQIASIASASSGPSVSSVDLRALARGQHHHAHDALRVDLAAVARHRDVASDISPRAA